MPQFSIFVGILLVAAAFVAYSGADKKWFGDESVAVVNPDDKEEAGSAPKKSLTALIPVLAGFPIMIFATLALLPGKRKLFMHCVVTFALLGTIAGLGRGLVKVGSLMNAPNYETMRPVIFSLLMGVLCLVLMVACVLSFIAARRLRAAENA